MAMSFCFSCALLLLIVKYSGCCLSQEYWMHSEELQSRRTFGKASGLVADSNSTSVRWAWNLAILACTYCLLTSVLLFSHAGAPYPVDIWPPSVLGFVYCYMQMQHMYINIITGETLNSILNLSIPKANPLEWTSSHLRVPKKDC